ncbi:MAG: DUF2062 domain-containing protein [Planctomycetota bacterium]|nr:MAG: DUF2062 domain-containing protein [Planctomycetota bacterium]
MWQWLKEKLRKYVRFILQLEDTPESIARGVAIGMFVAMTPTVGLQMLIVVFISFFIQLNRLAGIVMVYISNPFTLVPIYWLDYLTGAYLFGYELVSWKEFQSIFQLEETVFYRQFWEFLGNCLSLGAEVLAPMFLGGIFWGAVLGLPLYPLTLYAVRRYQRQKKQPALKEGDR